FDFIEGKSEDQRFRHTTVNWALAAWKHAAGPDAPIHVSPKLENGPDFWIELAPSQDLFGLEAIVAGTQYNRIGSYEDDGILNVARLADCRMLRAYDVSDLIAHPQRWLAPELLQNYSSDQEKGGWLINKVTVASRAWMLEREEFKFRAQYWNGRLLISH